MVVVAEEEDEWKMSSADAELLTAAAAETPDPMSPRALRTQLRSLDASVEQLQKLRKEATATTLAAMKKQLKDRDGENHSLGRRLRYLEAQIRGYEASGTFTARPTTVGHLQLIASTRAYILYPHMGLTSRVTLAASDLALLNLPERDAARPFVYKSNNLKGLINRPDRWNDVPSPNPNSKYDI